jgi:hypothetical protein
VLVYFGTKHISTNNLTLPLIIYRSTTSIMFHSLIEDYVYNGRSRIWRAMRLVNKSMQCYDSHGRNRLELPVPLNGDAHDHRLLLLCP